MATRQRNRSAQKTQPAISTQIVAEGVAPETVPEVKLHGEPVPVNREARIAEQAYRRAERRGFEPGYEIEDWLAAEREVDAELAGAAGESGNGPQDARRAEH